MSCLNYAPKYDLSRYIDIKPQNSYPQSIINEIKLLSFSKGMNAIPFGSYIYKIQKYPGDVDLIEDFSDCCSMDQVIEKFIRRLKMIIKEIRKRRYHYFSEFKAGLDSRYDIDIGSLKNGIYDINQEIGKISYQYYKNGLFNFEEYSIIIDIVNKSKDGPIGSINFDAMHKIFRDRKVLRWSEDEIMKGKKLLPGNSYIKLSTALMAHSDVKIDEIVLINGRFIEITNFIGLKYQSLPEATGDQYNQRIINIDIKEQNNINGALPKEIEKLYFSNMFYSPFKMVKRIFSLCRHNVKLPFYSETIKSIIPFISSDISLLYQIKSEIDSIILILERVNRPPIKIINNQIDEMRDRLSRVIEIVQEKDIELNNVLNEIIMISGTGKQNKENKISLLKEVKHFLVQIINFQTINYLQTINLNPPPEQLLPKTDFPNGTPIIKYSRDLIRKQEDDPVNPYLKIKSYILQQIEARLPKGIIIEKEPDEGIIEEFNIPSLQKELDREIDNPDDLENFPTITPEQLNNDLSEISLEPFEKLYKPEIVIDRSGQIYTTEDELEPLNIFDSDEDEEEIVVPTPSKRTGENEQSLQRYYDHIYVDLEKAIDKYLHIRNKLEKSKNIVEHRELTTLLNKNYNTIRKLILILPKNNKALEQIFKNEVYGKLPGKAQINIKNLVETIIDENFPISQEIKNLIIERTNDIITGYIEGKDIRGLGCLDCYYNR